MKTALHNFYKCITNHPEFLPNCNIFIGYTSRYANLANDISKQFSILNSELNLTFTSLEADNIAQIKKSISNAHLFILFYDSDYTQPLGRSQIVQQILPELKQYWQKSCVLKDYGDHFNEAFGVCPTELNSLNNQLIDIASKSKYFIYRDCLGSELEVDITNAKWTSVCGCGNLDLVPGEIASIGSVNGIVNFTGAFLSIVPFAPKYGIINEPLTLNIENNIIVDVKSDNLKLVSDFKKYIKYNPSNGTIEELGIGTNYAVKLHGINAGFEERHVGLHLGLGGGKTGSDHLDLIFQNGSLYFDNTQIIKDGAITFNS